MKNNYGIGGNVCFTGKEVGTCKLHVEGQHVGTWMELLRFLGHGLTQNKRSTGRKYFFLVSDCR
jgi:hypothetical protein